MTDLSISNILKIALSGIGGTLAMTAFMFLVSLLTRKRLEVTRILGTMLTNQTQTGGRLSDSPLAVVTGIIAHYTVGIVFALSYLLLWHYGIGEPTYGYAVLFGFINGLAGIMVWRLFLALHPHPPLVHLKPYLISLVLAHIVFAEGVVLCCHWLSNWHI